MDFHTLIPGLGKPVFFFSFDGRRWMGSSVMKEMKKESFGFSQSSLRSTCALTTLYLIFCST